MKVVCINDGDWVTTTYSRRFFWQKKKPKIEKGPKKDDVVTVLKERWVNGKKYYHLMEWPTNGIYNSEHFRPLEEKYDEVKFSEIKEKSSVN